MKTKQRPKKAKPSFDVARAAVKSDGNAWVYRSDSPAPPATATPPATASAAPPTLVEAVPLEPALAAQSKPKPETEPEAEKRSGWLGASVGLMTMPLTLAMIAMTVPVLWVFGSRPRR